MIPFIDLKRAYLPIEKEIQEAIGAVLDSQSFILGDIVEQFEREIADYCGTEYAIGVASGTDALVLSLMAAEILPGDEIITTPFTFIATAEAIVRVGAVPVFVDIDPQTYNIDPDRIAEAVTPKTKAIIPVHLYGQCTNMQKIKRIADEYRLVIIEDAAQAFGATHGDRMAGSMGKTGCHSFFPTKNLGAFGDGGMVTTDSKLMYDSIRALRRHGLVKGRSCRSGLNSRLDAIQAAVLSVKLRHVDSWIMERQRIAERYDEAFAFGNVFPPATDADNRHTYNLYTIAVPKREAFLQSMSHDEIDHRIYYPIPLHLQPCFEYLGYRRGDFPATEYVSDHVISLPIYQGMTQSEQEIVIDAITQTVRIHAFY